MPKWKKTATHFSVSVNHNDKRGYQSTIPKPVMKALGNPTRITFLVKQKKKIEIVASDKAEDKEAHNEK